MDIFTPASRRPFRRKACPDTARPARRPVDQALGEDHLNDGRCEVHTLSLLGSNEKLCTDTTDGRTHLHAFPWRAIVSFSLSPSPFFSSPFLRGSSLGHTRGRELET